MLKKEFNVDKLKVKVYDNRQSMGQAAADEAVAYLKELLANQDEVWAIFGAAPSQNEILAGLGKMYVADERFKKNIDKYGEGTAEFASEAIAVFCKE